MIRELALLLWRVSVFTILSTVESVIGLPLLSLAWLFWSREQLTPASYLVITAWACLLYSVLFSLSLTWSASIVVGLTLIFSASGRHQQSRNRLLGVLIGSVSMPIVGGLVLTPLVWAYGCAIALVSLPTLRRFSPQPLRLTIDTQWWKQLQP